MDPAIKKLMELAAERGGRYRKGGFAVDELQEMLAELGVLLLASAKRVPILKGDELREELNDIQNKIDDFRKEVFHVKTKKLPK